VAERLKDQASPYLRSAAHQPVDWYPWGPEAFERARREGKPILLDIGAAWCHWCHVIDRESYDDPQVAAIINQHFIPVKVDRDERPDVDARYQHAVQAIAGQGGWPLTAFLTPDGRVFYGGTYFPPVDQYGRPSFTRLLRHIAQYWEDHREELLRAAEEVHQRLAPDLAATAPGDLDPALVDRAIEQVRRAYDPQHGGFGRAPKFPHPTTLELLIRRAYRTGDTTLTDMVVRTLEQMGRGGVYDQLGGGFHRYSVDARWIVPHFEKMLYDNAPLLRVLVQAYRLTQRPFLAELARGTYRYLATVLADRDRGGFYASQDADVGPHDDGDFYTWTLDEVRAVLPDDEFRVAVLHYDIGERGEMQHDPRRNVLHIARDPDAIALLTGLPEERVVALLASARERLAAARAQRPRPAVDATVYAGWNGMAVSACLEASIGLGIAEARDLALRALDRTLEEAYRPGVGVAHRVAPAGPAHFGLLDDQVHVAAACLDAFEVTGRARYLAVARDLAEVVLREHEHPSGGFTDVARSVAEARAQDEPVLAAVNKPVQDSPTPAANGVAVLVLNRLSRLLDEPRYRQAAERTLRAFAGVLADFGLYASTAVIALDDFLREPAHVVVVAAGRDGKGSRAAAGPPADALAAALHDRALRTFRPDKIVTLVPSDGNGAVLPAPVRAMVAAAATGTRAYVCAGTACAPPTADPDELARLIESFGRS